MEPARIEETVAGHRVLVVAETASSNALVRELAADGRLVPGDAVLAIRQTGGRGRRGRSWITVPGRSLALSVLLQPPALERPASLALMAAVATCRALERRGAPALAIKWPNDVMRGRAKVGGLLLEQTGDRRMVVLGVGVNLALRAGDLPGEVAGTAGDVGLATDDAARRGHVHCLLEELDRVLGDPRDATGAGWRDEYRARSWLPGLRVELLHAGRPVDALVDEVTPDGDLVLADGRRLPGEHVELLRVHGAPGPGRAG